MKNKQIMILCIVVIGMLGTTIGQAVATDPQVETVTFNPSEPAVQSTVTVTATITGDTVEAVRFIYKECDPELCKLTENISMTETSEGVYEATFTLTYDKATYMTYHFNIKSGGSWKEIDKVDITLQPKQNGDSNGNGSNPSPGFELLLVLVALSVLVILFGKKRYK
jgi:PKD repeat protein